MNNRSHWSRSAVAESAIGIRLLVACYRIGGRGLAGAVMLPIIAFYFATTPRARNASLDYLRRVARTQNWETRPGLRHSFYHFWCFGLSLIDKFAAWLNQIPLDRVSIENLDILDELIAEGRGGLLLISHLGNFEVCRALSRTHPVKLTIIHHTKSTATFNRLLERFMDDSTMELLQVTEFSAATALRLSEKLSRGEFVAIAGDRIPIDNAAATVSLPFLGSAAAFPSGPFALALALEAPVLLLICVREGKNFRIVFEHLDEGRATRRSERRERRERIQQLAGRYAARLEHHLLAAPWQWFNFYDYWRATDIGVPVAPAARASSIPGDQE